jgi:hypothetical protein
MNCLFTFVYTFYYFRIFLLFLCYTVVLSCDDVTPTCVLELLRHCASCIIATHRDTQLENISALFIHGLLLAPVIQYYSKPWLASVLEFAPVPTLLCLIK